MVEETFNTLMDEFGEAEDSVEDNPLIDREDVRIVAETIE